MFSQDDDNQGLVLGVLFGIIMLVISLVLGMALYKTQRGAGSGATAVSGHVAPTSVVMSGMAGAGNVVGSGATSTATLTNGADTASVRVEGGVVKFYFASGKAELAPGAREALADIVKGVAAGQKAVISGYHDVTGDPAKNEELAKLRAFAVRDALASLGIGEDKLELKKPQDTTASGTNAEARRVEVTLQ